MFLSFTYFCGAYVNLGTRSEYLGHGHGYPPIVIQGVQLDFDKPGSLK